MSGKIVLLAALTVVLFANASLWSQTPQAYESEQVQSSPEGTAAEPPTAIIPSSGLSDWITYRRDLCCNGPVDGPPSMATEFFIRGGPTVPVGNEAASSVLGVGWMIDGGARFLYFDPQRTSAWALTASLSNQHNRGDRTDILFPLRRSVNLVPNAANQIDQFVTINAAVRALNRTFVNIGFGREYYLWGSAGTANQWRVGFDGGGRYGTAKADFFYQIDDALTLAAPNGLQIRNPHRVDVIGGAFASAHTDFEVPAGCCTYFGGGRLEWAYTWSDILQRQSDIMELNLLLTLGVRY